MEEARVLGALSEKDMATPEYYPMSLNALTNACNQKTNRDPVTAFDDVTVRDALNLLRDRNLAVFVSEAGSRVEKYRHKLAEKFNFTRGEQAILTVLLLRGPQTAAELRERGSRMAPLDDLETVTHTLERLAAREPDPLVRLLPKAPGAKEPRWAHLLCGEPELHATPQTDTAAPAGAGLSARVEQLERELSMLRSEFEALRGRIEPLL
jgi:hypothetical protein